MDQMNIKRAGREKKRQSKIPQKTVARGTLPQSEGSRRATRAAQAFGEVIKAEREDRALSVEQFADYARLSTERVRELERGEDEPFLMELWWISAALEQHTSTLVNATIDQVENP